MPPVTPTARPLYSPADLAAAAATLDAARREWERYGLRSVSDEDVEVERARVEAARRELQAVAARAGSRVDAVRYRFLRVAGTLQQLFGLEDRFGWVVAVLLGLAGTVAVAPAVLLFRPPAGPGAAILVGTFLLTTAAGLLFVLGAGPGGLTAAADRLGRERATDRDRVQQLADEVTAGEERLGRLVAAHLAQAEYREAVARHRKFEDLLTGERYQLQTTDWRGLRGAEWVDFLARVFKLLGYRVEATRPGQGADLVVHGKGRRIAVQAVGAADAVGPGPVQAAFAGKTYYGCTDCLVVATGRFTDGAVEAAERAGCGLVDADKVPALIDGGLL
ncbi:MAG: restriction endonuclease [Gemmataceae bacterium]|nr:restriction endonuclease [Gemmataceae bacterium]